MIFPGCQTGPKAKSLQKLFSLQRFLAQKTKTRTFGCSKTPNRSTWEEIRLKKAMGSTSTTKSDEITLRLLELARATSCDAEASMAPWRVLEFFLWWPSRSKRLPMKGDYQREPWVWVSKLVDLTFKKRPNQRFLVVFFFKAFSASLASQVLAALAYQPSRPRPRGHARAFARAWHAREEEAQDAEAPTDRASAFAQAGDAQGQDVEPCEAWFCFWGDFFVGCCWFFRPFWGLLMLTSCFFWGVLSKSKEERVFPIRWTLVSNSQWISAETCGAFWAFLSGVGFPGRMPEEWTAKHSSPAHSEKMQS